MDSSKHSAGNASFLDLPAEILTLIYEYVLVIQQDQPIYTHLSNGQLHVPMPLLTCHQIRVEGMPMYRSCNSFEHNYGWPTMEDCITDLAGSGLRWIRRLTLRTQVACSCIECTIGEGLEYDVGVLLQIDLVANRYSRRLFIEHYDGRTGNAMA